MTSATPQKQNGLGVSAFKMAAMNYQQSIENARASRAQLMSQDSRQLGGLVRGNSMSLAQLQHMPSANVEALLHARNNHSASRVNDPAHDELQTSLDRELLGNLDPGTKSPHALQTISPPRRLLVTQKNSSAHSQVLSMQ